MRAYWAWKALSFCFCVGVSWFGHATAQYDSFGSTIA